MNIRLVAGVDYRGGYRDSISAIKALGYEQAKVTLVHGWGSKQSPKQVVPTTNLLGAVLQQEAGNLIRNAVADCTAVVKDVESVVSSEQAIRALDIVAKEHEADLLVIRPTVRSNSNRPFGATTHGLLELMPASLLIARDTPTNMKVSKALFISDGTENATKAMREFERIAPPSIQSIKVLNLGRVLVGGRATTMSEKVELSTESFGGVEYTEDLDTLNEVEGDLETTLLVTYNSFRSQPMKLIELLYTGQPALILKTY